MTLQRCFLLFHSLQLLIVSFLGLFLLILIIRLVAVPCKMTRNGLLGPMSQLLLPQKLKHKSCKCPKYRSDGFTKLYLAIEHSVEHESVPVVVLHVYEAENGAEEGAYYE